MADTAPQREPRAVTRNGRGRSSDHLSDRRACACADGRRLCHLLLVSAAAWANYGTLLTTAPAPQIAGKRADGSPFRLDELRGRWVLLWGAPGDCGSACDKALYATRQARRCRARSRTGSFAHGSLTGDAMPAPAVLASHPDLVVIRVSGSAADALPGEPGTVYVIDPLGNLVLRYPDDPDIRGIANDLTRLLKASRIG